MTILMVAVLLGGLSAAMLQENQGASADVTRSEAETRALELAETGLARAELEIASNVDADGDGLGNVQGAYAGGEYRVTAVASGDLWTILSTGRTSRASRRIERGVRRVPTQGFAYAVFAHDDVTMGGSARTDSYDGRSGTWASQATHADSFGAYASAHGGIGSNDDIHLNGASVVVRGDAVPGPLEAVSATGGATVTGSVAARTTPMALAPTPLAEFQAAWNSNDDGSWTVTGGSVTYDAATRALTASGGAVVTLPPGTYFFSDVALTGGSALQVSGATRIYVTGSFDTSGGSIVNTTGDPSMLSILAHPYDLPPGSAGATVGVNVSGGADAQFTLYGPEAVYTQCSGDVFGALTVKTATLSGSSFVHYDSALAACAGAARIEPVYWLEPSPPVR